MKYYVFIPILFATPYQLDLSSDEWDVVMWLSKSSQSRAGVRDLCKQSAQEGLRKVVKTSLDLMNISSGWTRHDKEIM
jgi:hypothetical protein